MILQALFKKLEFYFYFALKKLEFYKHSFSLILFVPTPSIWSVLYFYCFYWYFLNKKN